MKTLNRLTHPDVENLVFSALLRILNSNRPKEGGVSELLLKIAEETIGRRVNNKEVPTLTHLQRAFFTREAEDRLTLLRTLQQYQNTVMLFATKTNVPKNVCETVFIELKELHKDLRENIPSQLARFVTIKEGEIVSYINHTAATKKCKEILQIKD